MKKFIHLVQCGLLFSLCISPYALSVEITLLVTYDDFTKKRFNDNTRAVMQNWVDGVNQIYVNSGVDLQLKLVHVANHNIAGDDMKQVLRNALYHPKIQNLRDEYKADFVTQVHEKGKCGIGYVTLSKTYAYNVVGPQCGFLTLAHELGHNMGLRHSRKQGDEKGDRYRYGLGYGVDGSFTTIMAYPSIFNTRKRLSLFSSPKLDCLGVPCGVPIRDKHEAFAVQALNNIKYEIANHRVDESEPVKDVPSDDASRSHRFGLRYLDEDTAILFHKNQGWTADWHYLCVNTDCKAGKLQGDFYERQIIAKPGHHYTLEFYVQDDQIGRCFSGSKTVIHQNTGISAISAC